MPTINVNQTNASETAKGIVEEATQAEVNAGTDTGGTLARLFVVPSKLISYVSAQLASYLTTAAAALTYTPITRTISTTAPLSGGGDLSANRTLTTSMATNKLIGRGTAGTGVMEEITLGTALSLSTTTLNATRTGVVREIWIPAASMTPRTTNGAATSTIETTTNDITIDVLNFDQTTSEGACWQMHMPSAWNGGTIKVKVDWISTTGAGTATWSIKAGSLADGDTLDTAYGTPQAVTDTLISNTAIQTSAATAAITIGGSPAVGDWIYFEISRDTADTLNADAQLVGIQLQYTETSTEPTAW